MGYVKKTNKIVISKQFEFDNNLIISIKPPKL